MGEINRIRDIINHDNGAVCIYGTGNIARGFYKYLVDIFSLEVNFFCDRDPSKWGTVIADGIFCISPKELVEHQECLCFVLIGQKFKESALRDLNALGVKQIITFDDVIDSDEVVKNILELSDTIDYLSDMDNSDSIPGYEYDRFVSANHDNKKVAIYTCITGGYEELIQPNYIDDNADYYCITDSRPKELGIYKWIDSRDVIPEHIEDNTRRNRFIKIWGTHLFSDYPYSVYVDGNIKIVGDVIKYTDKIGKSGFLSHKHAFEDCIFSEAIRVITNNRDDIGTIKKQMQKYYSNGMPRHFGMLHNTVLVRENNNEKCRSLMKNWWSELSCFSKRDQLSLTYCIWRMGLNISEMELLGNNMRKNVDFQWVSQHST